MKELFLMALFALLVFAGVPVFAQSEMAGDAENALQNAEAIGNQEAPEVKNEQSEVVDNEMANNEMPNVAANETQMRLKDAMTEGQANMEEPAIPQTPVENTQADSSGY